MSDYAKYIENLATPEELKRIAASLTDRDRMLIELRVLHCCAKLMLKGDPEIRVQAHEIQTVMLIHQWNRMTRDSWKNCNIREVG